MTASGEGVFALRHLMTIVREVSFDDLREQALETPRILLLGPDTEVAREIGLALSGPDGESAVTVRDVGGHIGDADRYDVVVVFDPERTGAAARTEDHLRLDGVLTPVVKFSGLGPTDTAAVDHLRSAILKRVPERVTAFGRALPLFRPAAVKQVIEETSMANAQFALVSNIPQLIPIVGNIASAGADLIVLTKNQVMLVFKLAAINGRDLNDQMRLLQEVAPAIGAGFLWRTAAREATNLLPFAAGTIPKVGIAYAGTMVVGLSADFYYRTNKKPTRVQLEQWRKQASDAMKRLPMPTKKTGTDG